MFNLLLPKEKYRVFTEVYGLFSPWPAEMLPS